MTPTTLDTLFKMNRKDITYGGSTYALNNRLNLPPWYPPCVEVWALREPPDNLSQIHRQNWNEVLELLDRLYLEHQRRKTK